MTTYLDLEDLLTIAAAAIGGEVMVRDHGLLESAAARPATTVFGHEAYPDDFRKAAALLHSLTGNHALVDGNKRLAWLATDVFLDINGHPRDRLDDDAVVDLVVSVADGSIADVDTIAERLRALWSD